MADWRDEASSGSVPRLCLGGYRRGALRPEAPCCESNSRQDVFASAR
jgi:hypothetical protein